MSDHSHLWNDLPIYERKRLMPYEIECHIRHIEQAKRMAVRAHEKHMKELNGLLDNLREGLERELKL